jgi:hypothetical protein
VCVYACQCGKGVVWVRPSRTRKYYLLSFFLSPTIPRHQQCTTMIVERSVQPPAKKAKIAAGDTRIYHNFHNDPTADIIIESNDGVSFRVSSHRLGNARLV